MLNQIVYLILKLIEITVLVAIGFFIHAALSAQMGINEMTLFEYNIAKLAMCRL